MSLLSFMLRGGGSSVSKRLGLAEDRKARCRYWDNFRCGYGCGD
jgi:hypothetical protein